MKKFVKKKKSGDILLAKTVSWQVIHLWCNVFCRTQFAEKFLTLIQKLLGIARILLLSMVSLQSYQRFNKKESTKVLRMDHLCSGLNLLTSLEKSKAHTKDLPKNERATITDVFRCTFSRIFPVFEHFFFPPPPSVVYQTKS